MWGWVHLMTAATICTKTFGNMILLLTPGAKKLTSEASQEVVQLVFRLMAKGILELEPTLQHRLTTFGNTILQQIHGYKKLTLRQAKERMQWDSRLVLKDM